MSYYPASIILFCKMCGKYYQEKFVRDKEVRLSREKALAAVLGGSQVITIRCWKCFMKDPAAGVRDDMQRPPEDCKRLQ